MVTTGTIIMIILCGSGFDAGAAAASAADGRGSGET